MVPYIHMFECSADREWHYWHGLIGVDMALVGEA